MNTSSRNGEVEEINLPVVGGGRLEDRGARTWIWETLSPRIGEDSAIATVVKELIRNTKYTETILSFLLSFFHFLHYSPFSLPVPIFSFRPPFPLFTFLCVDDGTLVFVSVKPGKTILCHPPIPVVLSEHSRCNMKRVGGEHSSIAPTTKQTTTRVT